MPQGSFICYLPPGLNTDFVMPCDRYEMERIYTAIAFDPPSAHYVGASAIAVPFQAYDEEGEIQIGPSGQCSAAGGGVRADTSRGDTHAAVERTVHTRALFAGIRPLARYRRIRFRSE